MISTIVPPLGTLKFDFAASDKIATYSDQQYSVVRLVGFPNFPDDETSVYAGSGLNASAAITAAGTAIVRAGATPVLVAYGASATIPQAEIVNYQGTPGTLNATGTLTAALILTGIVTSTTAAAVTATLDTGAVMEAALEMAIGDAFDWVAINTGAANDFTVTAAASGHTLVGVGAVQELTSVQFRTRKTASETFVTYRIS